MNLISRLSCAACVVLAMSTSALAQEEVPRVALYTDWSVFNPTDPRECFIASAPTNSEALRNGQPVQNVIRGAIRLYVASRPGEGTLNEIAFTGGYPFKDLSTVTVTIGDASFELFTEGEFAWPQSPDEDAKIVAAMQRGAKAVVTGLSSRNTTTIDTFSLIGFTDALKDSNARCGN